MERIGRDHDLAKPPGACCGIPTLGGKVAISSTTRARNLAKPLTGKFANVYTDITLLST